MEYGLHLGVSGPTATPQYLIHFARRGEELGFFCVTVADHIVIPKKIVSPYPYTASGQYPGTGDQLEQLTVLSFLAGATQRIRLVASVMVTPYRNPLLAAKELLGAPRFADRGEVTDEYIRVFRELWTHDNPSFEGRYCRFSEIKFLPRSAQKRRIPIWIGGHSKRALRRAAALGDGWHPIGGVPTARLEPEDLRMDLDTLARYAERAGRNPREITVAFKASLYDREMETVPGRRRRFIGNAEEIASDVRAYKNVGVDYLILDVRGPDAVQILERMEWLAKEVLPLV
ncbi:MAG: LLM class flavin-dependent oxidoreductase [Deltaproteobacteria bacterium]|nr:LLM class flavin-dependent oxidoreductase [Deltaproteobacteria bacterium]